MDSTALNSVESSGLDRNLLISEDYIRRINTSVFRSKKHKHTEVRKHTKVRKFDVFSYIRKIS